MRFIALLLALLPVVTFAATTDRVVAVVNSEIITLSELKARTTLAARAMGVDMNDPASGNALLRRTLGELVDETLQQQYAQNAGLQLTKAELQTTKDRTITSMGQKNWEGLTKGLTNAANDKLRGEATWARLMAVSIAPRVQLGTAEIDKIIEEMSKTQNRTERNLSLIYLPHGTEDASPTAATRIAELRTTAMAPEATEGTFANLAKANSAAPSAAQGGSLGWLTNAEVPQGIADAIQGLGKGEISEPLRTPEGWLLVRVNDVRTEDGAMSMQPVTQYRLVLLAAERASDTEVKKLREVFENATEKLKTLDAAQAYLAVSDTQVQFNRSSDLGWVPQAALQPQVAKAVEATKVGEWSKVLEAPTQFSQIFVAGTRQTMPPEVLALRERVGQNLRTNRTELEARRFMRELRQRAFVDIRL
jgi:peptidyl-prolyl cis-trans isomerase SurA